MPTEIRIFYILTCPFSRRTIRAAQKFAMMNPDIRTDAIYVLEFHDIANEAKADAVSHVSINNGIDFEGTFPEEVFGSYVFG